MKNIFKSILVMSAAALVAVSCNVDNVGTLYEPDGNGTGISFIQSVVNDTEISASQTSFTIPVARRSADGPLTVNLKSTLPNGVNVPSSVTFNAGEYQTDIVLDISSMAVGTSYKGTVSFADADAYDANTSISSVSLTFAKAYSWGYYGKVKITDDLIADVFGTDNVTWSVDAEKAEGFDVYRLLDPYGEAFPYNDPGDFTPGAKWVINAVNPNAVTFDRTYLGFNWGYGEFNIYLLNNAVGTMVNKVITFPVNSIAFNLPDYGTFYGNPSGLLAIDLNL